MFGGDYSKVTEYWVPCVVELDEVYGISKCQIDTLEEMAVLQVIQVIWTEGAFYLIEVKSLWIRDDTDMVVIISFRCWNNGTIWKDMVSQA